MTSLSNNTPSDSLKNKYTNTMNNGFNFVKNNTKVNNFDNPINSNINRDNTINYELNHSISHTKMNVGEIKRLSAAVIINFTKDKNGKSIPFATDKIKNIEHLIRETIGYSKSRGDSVHVVNALFAKHQEKMPIPLKHPSPLQFSYILFSLTPWFLSALFLCLLLKKYICPVSRNNVTNNRINNEKKYTEKYENIEKNTFQENIKNNFNTDTLIHQICNISNQNPRTIALIIRKWMSDKI